MGVTPEAILADWLMRGKPHPARVGPWLDEREGGPGIRHRAQLVMHYNTREAACRDAEKVRQRMVNPEAWEVSVWENLDWYWALRHCGLYVYPTTVQEGVLYFACLFGRSGDGGEIFWSGDSEYSDPNAAVRGQLKRARAFLDQVNSLYLTARKVVRGKGVGEYFG